MDRLNLPEYPFKLRRADTHTQIFDEVRKKWLVLTPEEWVRQHFVQYLHRHLAYPLGLMRIEGGLSQQGRKFRSDIVVHNREGKACLLVECKAPSVELGNDTFTQAAQYNRTLGAAFIVISNGLKHYCARIDHEKASFEMLTEIPPFSNL